jgi:hypothetical protein
LPSYRNIQSQLYKKRRAFIPANPSLASGLETDSPWFTYNQKTGESVVKRILVLSTDEHLEVLARAEHVLGDGTFIITPQLWLQTFIISAQVQKDIFIPFVFAFLPDKSRYSYDEMFSLVKYALADRGLSLSAEFFMSDFELNIRNSFSSLFPEVTPKGCHFHFAKAIFSKVTKNGLKSDYSDAKNGKFGGFVRACIGLPYVPLDRLFLFHPSGRLAV